MVRSIVAVLLGLVVAVVVIVAVEQLGTVIYPPPPGMDWNNRAEMAAFVRAAPVGVMLLVLVGYAAGCLAGGFVAAWVARRAQATHALIVGAFLMAMGLINLLTLPHPAWFWALSLLAYLPPAYVGARLAPRPPTAPPGPATESLAA